MNKDQQKMQKTKQGHEIPVPKKADVFRDLLKALSPTKKSGSARRSRKKG